MSTTENPTNTTPAVDCAGFPVRPGVTVAAADPQDNDLGVCGTVVATDDGALFVVCGDGTRLVPLPDPTQCSVVSRPLGR